MGQLLLWSELVLAALLLLGFTTAFSVRRNTRTLGWLAWLTLVACGAAGVLLTLQLQLRNVSPNGLTFVSTWAAAVALGGGWLVRRGMRRSEEGGQPAAADWPQGVLGGAFLAVAVAFLVTLDVLHSAMEARLAVLAAEQRASALDLAPLRVADRENAAPAYRDAFDALDAPQGMPKWWAQIARPSPKQASTPEEDARAMEVAQPILRLYRQAAARPGYFFETDHIRLRRAQLPSLLNHRRLANLAAWDAVERARAGDTEGAAADIAAIWRTSRHLGSGNHFLIGHLIAVAIEGIGTDALEDVLAVTTAWKADDLAALSREVPASVQPGLARVWRIEEVAGLTTAVDLASGAMDGADFEDFTEMPIYTMPGIAKLTRVLLLEGDIDSARRAYARAIGAQEQWKPVDVIRSEKEFTEQFVSTRHGLLTWTMFPSMLRAGVSTRGAEARARLARAAIAATRYRIAQKSWPRSLESLMPQYLDAVPVDPHSGSFIRMVEADGGLVLYGVGGDQKDDGGVEPRRGDGATTADITFCLGEAYAKRRAAANR